MAEKTATFGIKIPVETNAASAGSSVEQLRASIAASQDAVRNYQSSLQKLRGKSDEVKAAKEKLKAAVEAERDAISRATLALGKQGLTLGMVDKAAKEAAARWKAHTAAQEEAKKSSTSALEKFQEMKKGLTDTSTATGLAVTGFMAMAAAAAALAVGVASTVVSLAKFVFESANALRTMSLFREAATGSASNAKAFGHQIDALADKIPTTREELQNLSLDISRSMAGTRVSGQGAVDTFNAVAQASAAMGDSAGRAIQGIIDRSKQFGRLGLGLYELQGTGIAFQDVAAQLAGNLKISLDAAQQQLRMGRVNVNAGAAAIRQAIEKNLGGVNKKLMLDFGVQIKKLKDNWVGLTEGLKDNGALDRVLEGFAHLGKLFDKNTVTGSALKQLITDFGTGAEKVFKGMLPLAEKFFKQLVIESLKFEIAGIRLYNWAKKTFGPDFLSGVDGARVAITSAKVVFAGFAVAILSVAAAAALLAAPFIATYAAISKLGDLFKELKPTFMLLKEQLKKDSEGLGGSIVKGLLNGMLFGLPDLATGALQLAKKVKDSFTGSLQIHSPSKVFAEYGRQTAEGYAQGLDGAGSGAQAAANRLAPSAPAGGGRASGGVKVDVTVVFPNVKDGPGAAAAMGSKSFIADMVKAFEEVLASQGVPNA